MGALQRLEAIDDSERNGLARVGELAGSVITGSVIPPRVAIDMVRHGACAICQGGHAFNKCPLLVDPGAHTASRANQFLGALDHQLSGGRHQ